VSAPLRILGCLGEMKSRGGNRFRLYRVNRRGRVLIRRILNNRQGGPEVRGRGVLAKLPSV
jgi:hypothetical protein